MSTNLSIAGSPATLILGGESIPLVSVQLSYSEDRINSADCVLAAGMTSLRGSGGGASFDFPRFTEAEIQVDLSQTYTQGSFSDQAQGSSYTLFKGVLDDIGPGNLAGGGFVMTARLLGRLAKLDTGSLSAGGVLANQYADLTFPMPGPGGAKILTEDSVGRDFGSALLSALITVCSDSGVGGNSQITPAVLALLDGVFGEGRGNADAAEILGEFRTSGSRGITLLEPYSGAGFANSLALFTDYYLKNDLRSSSFYQILSSLGRVLGFRPLETAGWTALVPFTPFPPHGSAYRTIEPDTYVAVSRSVSDTNQCGGVLLVTNIPNQGNAPIASGSWTRPSGGGRIRIEPAPSFLRIASRDQYAGKVSPTDSDVGQAVNQELVDTVGNEYAREMGLMANYAARMYTVTCPYIRTDLCPCTPVKLVYPDIYADLGGFSTAVYGSVKSVNISLDASSGTASTVITVGYARSSNQQAAEVDARDRNHPLWQAAFAGSNIAGE